MKEPITLLFMLAAKSRYRETIISENEVFCSPDDVTRFEKGRPVTIETPVGSFDVGEVTSRLPQGFEPELIVVKMDPVMLCVPRGLERFSCPKVMILGAPHQFSHPLSTLLNYLESERFDLIVSDHDRHHLHWFKRAGFPRVHWLPGLNFNLRERPIVPPKHLEAVFVGQTGKFHPYRKAMFERLKRMGLPIAVTTALADKTADIYSTHAICLNGSLNGDLNLRVFEILGSGGFLLTDKISADTGLERLFQDGKELALYRGTDDLAAKINWHLDRPEETLAIRKAGHAKLLAEHRPELKRRQFLDLVFEGKEEPLFALDDHRFLILAALPKETERSNLSQYEYLQELHIRSYRIIVYTQEESTLRFATDLPRLERSPIEESASDIEESPLSGMSDERALALTGGEGTSEELGLVVEQFVGRHIILVGPLEEDKDFAATLSGLGYEPVAERRGVFKLTYALAAVSRWIEREAPVACSLELREADESLFNFDELSFAAQAASALGELELCLKFLRRCIALDRSLIDVHVAMAQIHWQLGQNDKAFIAINEAGRLGELPEEALPFRGEIEAKRSKESGEVIAYLNRCSGGARKLRETPLRILVYTNLMPPQELGGYGRKMWEFAYELGRRGHELKILAGDAPYLSKTPEGEEGALEDRVSRVLKMFGRWADGKAEFSCFGAAVDRVKEHNREAVRVTIRDFRPDCCLMGNLDMLGHFAIEELAAAHVPTVQCMGNFLAGWDDGFAPDERWYRPGPASDFLRGELERRGFAIKRPQTLYPGARLDLFYRYSLPSYDFPRIVFAGLLMGYKGAHTLVEALGLLKQGGLTFEATIAGDSTDQSYVQGLKNKIAAAGLDEAVDFPGFLNRRELNDVFCRSNVLVFPSIVDEAFGISQVEAMASGLAVITSGTGGSKEIIRDGIDGLLFEKENAVDLAKKIASLLADPKRWRQIAEAGRERALKFSIPATVDRIESLFDEMKRENAGLASK